MPWDIEQGYDARAAHRRNQQLFGVYENRYRLGFAAAKHLGKQALKGGTAYQGAKRAYNYAFGDTYSTPQKKFKSSKPLAPPAKRAKMGKYETVMKWYNAGAKGPIGKKKSGRGRKKQRGSKAVVRRDGVGAGRRVKNKRKRSVHKKKSLKKRVRALEKGKPLNSKIHYEKKADYVMYENVRNSMNWYAIPIVKKGEIQIATNELTGNATGTAVKVNNCRGTFTMKNNGTANVDIEYQIFKCVGNCVETIMFDLREDLYHRAKIGEPLHTHLGLQAVIGEQGHVATSVRVPERYPMANLYLDGPMWSGNRSSATWKPAGNIRRTRIGPGDTIDITTNTGPLTYNVDHFSEADSSTLYYKGVDQFLVIRVRGPMGHDSANPGNVGWAGYHLDAQLTQSVRAFHVDGEGTNVYSLNTQDDSGDMAGTVDFADNVASAIQTMVD